MTLADRFWSKVRKADGDGCWLWTASLTRNSKVGYGQFNMHDSKGQWRPHHAHRVAWFLTYGRWPDPCGLHACDNPPCVRVGPGHVFEGTKAQNSADMKAKKRGRGRCSDLRFCKRGHEFTDANTGRTAKQRYCRTCHNERQNRVNRERKLASVGG